MYQSFREQAFMRLYKENSQIPTSIIWSSKQSFVINAQLVIAFLSVSEISGNKSIFFPEELLLPVWQYGKVIERCGYRAVTAIRSMLGHTRLMRAIMRCDCLFRENGVFC